MTDALKAATTAKLQDKTMLSIELATSETLHIPLYDEYSQRAWEFFGCQQGVTRPIRELEIEQRKDAKPLLRLIGPNGQIEVSAPEDALEFHSEFFEEVGIAG